MRSEVPCHPELAGRVVDRDDGLPVIYGSVCILEYFGITEVLPLLHGERLVLWHAQAHRLALRVERIEVDVGDDAEGTGRGGERELGQLLVGKSRAPASRRASHGG